MATRADALEELRIAKMVLQIAKDNNYSKVISFLDENVQKAQNALDAFDRYSPRKLLKGLFNIVAPVSNGPGLPISMKQVTIIDYV
jgi:hypothetical protein